MHCLDEISSSSSSTSQALDVFPQMSQSNTPVTLSIDKSDHMDQVMLSSRVKTMISIGFCKLCTLFWLQIEYDIKIETVNVIKVKHHKYNKLMASN